MSHCTTTESLEEQKLLLRKTRKLFVELNTALIRFYFKSNSQEPVCAKSECWFTGSSAADAARLLCLRDLVRDLARDLVRAAPQTGLDGY